MNDNDTSPIAAAVAASGLRTRRWYIRRTAIIAAGIAGVLTVVSLVSFLIPRSTGYVYSQTACFVNPLLLPSLTSVQGSTSFSATTKPSLSVRGFPLYSHETCLRLDRPVSGAGHETLALVSRSFRFLRKPVQVRYAAPPAVGNQKSITGPVSTQDPLVFQLDADDGIFGYRLHAGGRTTDCNKHGRTVSCDLARLQLGHAAEYDFRLERLLRGKSGGPVFERRLATVEAVRVTGSSIGGGQTLYTAPDEAVLSLSRPATTFKDVRLFLISGTGRQELPIAASLAADKLTVRFSHPLPRSSNFELSAGRIDAADGGYLPEPYVLSFRTSGGPKVGGASIGTYRIQPGSSVVLTFDSPVSTTQSIADYVLIESAGRVIARATGASDRQVSLALPGSLPACTGFTVRVLDGLQNVHGVSGNSAWQLNSRTTCQTSFSIGTSVQGRSITAYRFGGGDTKVVFVGTTHGDERSSATLLTKWIDYLEANPQTVPAGRSVIIIPVVSPDSYAANRRTNANNVDLNRNFPAHNWKSGVTMPDKSFLANGGGSSSLSEPESKALADYITALNPRLTLTYHATGGVVVPNDSGDSNALALNYASRSSVNFMANSSTATFFEYDTTGAFEDWLHDKPGLPALLVELDTRDGNEFNGHVNAMKAIVQL